MASCDGRRARIMLGDAAVRTVLIQCRTGVWARGQGTAAEAATWSFACPMHLRDYAAGRCGSADRRRGEARRMRKFHAHHDGVTLHLSSVLVRVGLGALEDGPAVLAGLLLRLCGRSCLLVGPLLVALPLLEERLGHGCGRSHGCCSPAVKRLERAVCFGNAANAARVHYCRRTRVFGRFMSTSCTLQQVNDHRPSIPCGKPQSVCNPFRCLFTTGPRKTMSFDEPGARSRDRLCSRGSGAAERLHPACYAVACDCSGDAGCRLDSLPLGEATTVSFASAAGCPATRPAAVT